MNRKYYMKDYEQRTSSYTSIGCIEFWSRDDAWYRPWEWKFGIDQTCYNKCVIFEIGFVGITWLRNECRGLS